MRVPNNLRIFVLQNQKEIIMKKTLSKTNQIKVLVAVKKYFKGKTNVQGFICSETWYIIDTYIRSGEISLDRMFNIIDKPHLLIPLLTIENAKKICEDNDLMLPNGDYAWWTFNNENNFSIKVKKSNEIRYKFLTCLIRKIRNS